VKKALLIAPHAITLERFCEANIAALIRLGYELHLAANTTTGIGGQHVRERIFFKEAEANNITVHPLRIKRQSFFGNLGALHKIRTLLRKGRFDLIHAHTETGGLLLWLTAGSAKGAKLIYTPHGMSFYRGSSLISRFIYRPIERLICAKCSAVIAINREEHDILKKWNAKTAFFTHGVGIKTAFGQTFSSSQKRTELNIPQEALLLVSVGELNANKNHIVCIKALKRISRTDIRYLICGEGALKQRLDDEAEKLGLGDSVITAGYRSDVRDILACSDIFLFPSRHEGLPVSLLEAMCAGLPVICSRIRGNTDLIEAGVGGILLEPDDADAWAEAIALFAEDPELRLKMGAHNKAATGLYDIETVRSELVHVYSSVL
jgi:glycosyltransferase involved in cell wall biosynthesis